MLVFPALGAPAAPGEVLGGVFGGSLRAKKYPPQMTHDKGVRKTVTGDGFGRLQSLVAFSFVESGVGELYTPAARRIFRNRNRNRNNHQKTATDRVRKETKSGNNQNRISVAVQ